MKESRREKRKRLREYELFSDKLTESDFYNLTRLYPFMSSPVFNKALKEVIREEKENKNE